MSGTQQVYGGDEVNAIVLDPGSAWTRIGWSAEDGPGITVSSAYAEREGKRQFGDEYTYLVRPDTDIKTPFADSIVTDWDAATSLWKAGLSEASAERNTDFLTESPLLITEPYWGSAESQSKTMEFALEDLNVPAMYIAKSPVLSLFAAGRGTGLVVDVGAQTLSVTPVVDGLCLYKPARRSRRAGNYLNEQIRAELGDDIVANYQLKSKEIVPVGEPAKFELKTDLGNITPSFHEYQIGRVMEQFKEGVVQVQDSPLSLENIDNAEAYAKRTFEFPDGHSAEYGVERFAFGEKLFRSEDGDDGIDVARDETSAKTKEDKPAEDAMEVDEKESTEAKEVVDGSDKEWSTKGLSTLVIESLKACDVDIRANLANNIVVTGGSTLLQGLTERINQDLQHEFPMFKIRIFASGNMVERRNSAWIGGSILASLGTFHQLWVTRQEYEEVGAQQLSQKRFR